jgi:hypothetical protein
MPLESALRVSSDLEQIISSVPLENGAASRWITVKYKEDRVLKYEVSDFSKSRLHEPVQEPAKEIARKSYLSTDLTSPDLQAEKNICQVQVFFKVLGITVEDARKISADIQKLAGLPAFGQNVGSRGINVFYWGEFREYQVQDWTSQYRHPMRMRIYSLESSSAVLNPDKPDRKLLYRNKRVSCPDVIEP